MKTVTYSVFLVFLLKYVEAIKLPSSLVYVVTPSSRTQSDEGRSAPFYYHNWVRRMDSPKNTTATTTKTPRINTPDLIFAEFESDNGDNMRKSIRKLLEKERVKPTTTTTSSTTSQPIHVVDEDIDNGKTYTMQVKNTQKEETKEGQSDMTDYFALYNNFYNNERLSPVYLPSTTTTTTTTTISPPANVENIWHIIDSEKHDQLSGQWEEVPVDSNDEPTKVEDENADLNKETPENRKIIEDFALPGFNTNPGNGAENESRAIRTEPNIRFPYVSLKPFQMKNLNVYSNSKKGNNMFTNLDNFKELKNPVRGEAQDVISMRDPVDRYNPAQPYLPQPYGSKSKQSNPVFTSPKTVANLVPPPPPLPPKVIGNDFPAPTSYESFPPYAPSALDSPAAQASPIASPPVSIYQSPMSTSDDDDSDSPPSDSNNGPIDIGYRYKAPAPSPPIFVPTLPPISKPFTGYSYNKPASTADTPPIMNMGGYSYNKPPLSVDIYPPMNMDDYTYNKPQGDTSPISNDKPDIQGYHYDKPSFPEDHPPLNYGHHDAPPFHDSDYPQLIFDKPHGSMGDIKGGKVKEFDVPMMPPPPPSANLQPGMNSDPSMDDNGFPPDFPGDLKFHHDFEDHDFHHHEHHTTTTTTETPRVNRYSYYYLGKKLYYLPLYFSVYFIVYVGALIIKAVLRHKIVYPNSWKPDGTTATFFSKRSVDSWDFSHDNLHEVTGRVTKALAEAAKKYINDKSK